MATFVIRIWDSAAEWKLDDRRLRGTLVDPSNGRTSPFTDEKELVALLRGEEGDGEKEGGLGGGAAPFQD